LRYKCNDLIVRPERQLLKKLRQQNPPSPKEILRELTQIPGVGKSIAQDLEHIGIYRVCDLNDKDPEALYRLSNEFAGCVQDRCLLYVFKCAVYFAKTPASLRDSEKLKWWNWKDGK
jgi:hypothetical protein